MKKLFELRNLTFFIAVLGLGLAMSCGDDDGDATPEPDVDPPVAAFSATADELTVTFSNTSANATSFAWDFGDGAGTSTEENPVYTYSSAGSYTITLTATNDGGSDTFSATLSVSSADEAITLLAGTESKTWKLLRDGPAVGVGPNVETFTEYFAFSNDGSRPCFFDDEFTFTRDGGFEFDAANTFWGEGNVWTSEGAPDRFETCFEPTVANMTVGGSDYSAWNSSDAHTYTYSSETQEITLTGNGAWMGLVKLGTNEEVASPQSSVTMNAALVDGGASGVDTLTVWWVYDPVVTWAAKYVSYANASDEPELLTEAAECFTLTPVSPTEISHTFASNETSEWTLLQPTESGSLLELGVNDPTDSTATKVGKYTRVADVQFQELKFKLDPLNAINFENMTTISLDVFIPSTNTYSEGGLTDNVFVGFGQEACPPDWFTDQHEYQELAVAKDEWVTITFDIATDVDFVGNPANGATLYDRNDMDMIYIAIGGSNHFIGGEFFIRNFSIQ